MSLVKLAEACSHLQNASRARLSQTSIPMTKMHLHLCLGLQKQGFLHNVTVAGLAPPHARIPSPSSRAELVDSLSTQPWLAFPDPAHRSLPDRAEDKVPSNVAERRIWVWLKYWGDRKVLSKLRLVSKPTRRIYLTCKELAMVTKGFNVKSVGGLKNPGECLFVSTDQGIWEAREVVRKGMGGQVMVRAL